MLLGLPFTCVTVCVCVCCREAPFRGLILICINTVVRMFPIITLNIALRQAASFYTLAHIRLRSLTETASLIPIFKRRLFHKDNPPGGSEGNQNSENEQRIPSFSPLLSPPSPLFLIPFPACLPPPSPTLLFLSSYLFFYLPSPPEVSL